jgi:nucleoid-associated protein YgaU
MRINEGGPPRGPMMSGTSSCKGGYDERLGNNTAKRVLVAGTTVVFAGTALAAWWTVTRTPQVAQSHQASAPVTEFPGSGPQHTSEPLSESPARAVPQPAAAPGPTETPVSTAAPSKLERAKAGGVTVKVKKGETLIDLAADHLGSPDLWRDLLEVNADRIDKPEHLRAGMLVRLPEGVRPATAEEIRVSRFRRSIKGMRFDEYITVAGDTLASIAQGHYGEAAKAAWIVNANSDTFPTPPAAEQPLTKGQRLRLPKEYVPGTGCGG